MRSTVLGQLSLSTGGNWAEELPRYETIPECRRNRGPRSGAGCYGERLICCNLERLQSERRVCRETLIPYISRPLSLTTILFRLVLRALVGEKVERGERRGVNKKVRISKLYKRQKNI